MAETKQFKAHKAKARCNKCKKLGHYARECTVPLHVIENLRKKFKSPKQFHNNNNTKSQRSCDACGKPGHVVADCQVLKAFRREHYHNKAQNESKRKRNDSAGSYFTIISTIASNNPFCGIEFLSVLSLA